MLSETLVISELSLKIWAVVVSMDSGTVLDSEDLTIFQVFPKNIPLSHLQNYQPENSASQYQLPKSHFFNRVERESLFLAHDPIIS